MGKFIATAVVLVGALFLTGLAVPAASAAPAAGAPEWGTGDQWALGWDPNLRIKNNATVDENVTLAISRVTGLSFEQVKTELYADAAFYVLFKVTEATPDRYIISTKLALKLEADGEISVTGKFPQAGTYKLPTSSPERLGSGKSVPDLSFIPEEDLEKKAAKVKLGADIALVAEGTIVLNKTRAIESIRFDVRSSAVINLDATNFPQVDAEGGSMVIAYRNYDVAVKAVLTMDANVLFAPPLDLFGSDQNGGKDRDAGTTANVSGEIGGFLDIKGLSEGQEKELLERDLLKKANMTKFPVNFADLISEGRELSDGEFGPIEKEISASFATKLGAAFAGHSVDVGELPFNVLGLTPVLRPVEPNKAEREISSIASYRQDIEKRAGDDNVTDLFFDPPYLGLMLVVVAAVVVGTALFLVTRARKQ